MGKADLAQIAGVGASAVTKWAAGGAIRPATLKRIADHFDVSIDWLLGGQSIIQVGTPIESVHSSANEPLPTYRAGQSSTRLQTCRIPEGCDIVDRLDRLEAEIHTLTRLLGARLDVPESHPRKKVG
jgi:transcriptional regulator with XRE-family HTH domain